MRAARPRLILAVLASLCLGAAVATAAGEQGPSIDWTEGPTVGRLEKFADVNVPEGYLFTGKKGAQRALELTHNLTSGNEVGLVVPRGDDDANSWMMFFEFSPIGFVKDADKEKIDAAALLQSMKEGTEAGNEERRKRGWSTFHVIDWSKPPYYDPITHNLTWALLIRNDEGGESINHSVRILGRRGTMNVDLVLDPGHYEATVSRFDSVLAGVAFREGNRYADFVKGDKVAKYGLAALVAGGVGAVAMKTGLLAKLGKGLLFVLLALKKAIVLVVVALFAFLKSIFGWLRRLFGGGNVETTPDASQYRTDASISKPGDGPPNPGGGSTGSGPLG